MERKDVPLGLHPRISYSEVDRDAAPLLGGCQSPPSLLGATKWPASGEPDKQISCMPSETDGEDVGQSLHQLSRIAGGEGIGDTVQQSDFERWDGSGGSDTYPSNHIKSSLGLKSSLDEGLAACTSLQELLIGFTSGAFCANGQVHDHLKGGITCSKGTGYGEPEYNPSCNDITDLGNSEMSDHGEYLSGDADNEHEDSVDTTSVDCQSDNEETCSAEIEADKSAAYISKLEELHIVDWDNFYSTGDLRKVNDTSQGAVMGEHESFCSQHEKCNGSSIQKEEKNYRRSKQEGFQNAQGDGSSRKSNVLVCSVIIWSSMDVSIEFHWHV